MALNSPTSNAELEAALDELIQRAFNNGVHVGNGGYELTHEESSVPDWDLTIIRMENRCTPSVFESNVILNHRVTVR